MDLVSAWGGVPADVARYAVRDHAQRLRMGGAIWDIPATPFLNIKQQITMDVFGQGLLGMVLDPAYKDNGLPYVTYVTPEHTVLERYRADTKNPLVADPDNRVRLMTIPHPTEYYGGQLAFGTDGYLYWSMGDGAQSKLIKNPAQDVGQYSRSIFRTIAITRCLRVDNPYVNMPNAKPEIWAKGLRNPWRFSFDRETGDSLWQKITIEELNVLDAPIKGGANFG